MQLVVTKLLISYLIIIFFFFGHQRFSLSIGRKIREVSSYNNDNDDYCLLVNKEGTCRHGRDSELEKNNNIYYIIL